MQHFTKQAKQSLNTDRAVGAWACPARARRRKIFEATRAGQAHAPTDLVSSRPYRAVAILTFVLLSLLTACAVSPSASSSPGHIVVQSTPKSRLTYVAIGASDTFGIGTDDPQTENWPTDLAGKLGDGVRLVNLGIPAIDVQQAVNVELPIALDEHPNLITVWLGVNDISDNVPLNVYSQNLDILLGKLRTANPHARIAVANVPDLTLLPHFQSFDASSLRAQIAAYNTSIATIVKRHQALLVDLYARWADLANHPEYISDDGFHPNAIGYTRLAEIFYQVLQEHP